jgi:hypothetical protein
VIATQAASQRLAERTRRTVTGLWALRRDGVLTLAQFKARATAEVAKANSAGVSLADVGLAAEITKALKKPTGPLGLRPDDVQLDQQRMADNIDRILDDTADDFDPEDSLGDWAASEPYLTVATTMQVGMRRHGIDRWVRVLSGRSCPLCEGWADDIARSVDTPMARHIGCDCIQQPVF